MQNRCLAKKISGHPRAFNYDDGVEARLLVAHLEPVDIVDHGVALGLDTAMISVDCWVRSDRCILVFQDFILIDEDLDILAQGSLIAFQRENVIGFFLDDFRGDVALAAHRIDRHHRALGRHHVEQRRDPGRKAKLEGAGVEHGEDIAEMIMPGRAVHIGSKPPPQLDLTLAELRGADERLRPSKNRQKNQEQRLRIRSSTSGSG